MDRKVAYNLATVQTGVDYERFIASILTVSNIPTIRVGQTGDYGANLLANTGAAAIQCKFYSHTVGYNAVKEAYTAKAIYHATTAYVASTTQVCRAARQLGVTLSNHAEITTLI